MAYSICSICGKFFSHDGNTKCPKCYDKYVKEYNIIREYVASHAGVTPMELNTVTGISINSILKLIEEGAVSCVNQK